MDPGRADLRSVPSHQFPGMAAASSNRHANRPFHVTAGSMFGRCPARIGFRWRGNIVLEEHRIAALSRKNDGPVKLEIDRIVRVRCPSGFTFQERGRKAFPGYPIGRAPKGHDPAIAANIVWVAFWKRLNSILIIEEFIKRRIPDNAHRIVALVRLPGEFFPMRTIAASKHFKSTCRPREEE